MRKLPLLSLAAAIVLMGAGCSFKPLQSSDEPKGFADVKVGDTKTGQPKSETPKPAETPKTDEPKEETPKIEEPKPETPTETTKANGYGGKVLGEVAMKADAGSIVVFLTAEKADYEGKDAYMEFGCESLLVPVKRDLTKTQSDLAEALVQLITIKQNAYADQGLRNAIAPSAPTIKLANIHYDGKTRVISFEGSFTSSGACEDPRIKAQIEETVKLYSDNYRIELNGSDKNWRCLFDQSGQCE